MSKLPLPYKETTPRDSKTRTGGGDFLKNDPVAWIFRCNLKPEQLNYAPNIVKVKSVVFYLVDLGST
jgi:hypothetical protein